MSEKKIAIVTGGSSGIGYAIAQKFIDNHICCYITGRSEEKLNKAAQALGQNCLPIQFDMDWIEEIPLLVERIMQKEGHIDILVNNAAINLKKSLVEVTNEDFQQVLLTNLTSVFILSREVSKVMIARRKGSIINISSMAAHYGIPKVIAYTASKSALEGMTRAMAVELSPLGIRVNCIAPGFIATPMSAKALDNDPDRKSKVLARTPLGILGDPADVANGVYFLTHADSRFITGEIIKVDGGNSIGF